MSNTNFSVPCRVCGQGVDSFSQTVRFILMPDGTVQEGETIILSCGCTIDFPDWQIDVQSGLCRIYDFAGTLYLKFLDKEMILEEDDE